MSKSIKLKMTIPADALAPFKGPLEPGDRVINHGNDYALEGVVLALFTTRTGQERYVVEHDCGLIQTYRRLSLGRLKTAP